jgi:hypothetical protein
MTHEPGTTDGIPGWADGTQAADAAETAGAVETAVATDAVGNGWRRRGAALLSASATSAPPALLTQLGLLFLIFGTKPVRPYAGGEWTVGDLVAFVVLGALAGLLGRAPWGFTGIVLGMTGAVALQLFVLTGQASWIPEVVSSLDRASWVPAVVIALAAALAALMAGYTLVRVVAYLLRARGSDPSGPAQPPEGRRARLVAPILLAAIGILVSGALLLDASASAYVPPTDQQTVHVVVNGRRIVQVEPTTIRAGRVTLSAVGTGVTGFGVFATRVLPPDQQAALAAGRIQYNLVDQALLSDTDPRQRAGPLPGEIEMERQVTYSGSGVYGFVISELYTTWTPPPVWDGWVPILDSRTIDVAAAAPGERRIRGDSGPVQPIGGLLGAVIGGWAAAGTVVVARRPRRSRVSAPIIGLVTGFLLWSLTLLAIDLSHNPF